MKLNLTLTLLTLLFSITAISSTTLLNRTPLPDALPTTYYIADETKTSCSGRYNGNDFDGTEISEVLTPNGELIANSNTDIYSPSVSIKRLPLVKDKFNYEFYLNSILSSLSKIVSRPLDIHKYNKNSSNKRI